MTRISERASVVGSLIGTWNVHFFLRRGVHFIFERVRKPSRRRSTSRGSRSSRDSRGRYSDDSNLNDFDTKEPLESEDDDDPRYRPGSRAGSRVGRHLRKRDTYSLRVESVRLRAVSGGPIAPGGAISLGTA